jgi:4-aminobutyrate aminotransferase-like enzyme
MTHDGTPAFVHSARPDLDRERVASILETQWGIRGTLADVGGDRDQNLVATTASGERWLIKIGQPGEAPGVLDMQLAALRHVARQDPELGVPRVLPRSNGEYLYALPAGAGGAWRMRVFGYVAGEPIGSRTRTPRLFRGVGATLARLDRALRGFFHPDAAHELLWDIRQIPHLRPCAFDIPDPRERDRTLRILDAFPETVLPSLEGLRAQVIHGDATADNVLVHGDPPDVAGLIDFGDAAHAPLVQELAVAMADTPYGLDDPWPAACEVAAGFDEFLPLEAGEPELLWDLARARLALTAAVLASRAVHRPEGPGSMASDVEVCRRQLDAFEAVGRESALRDLRRTLRLPESVPARTSKPADGAAASLLQRRADRLMPGLALFYPEDPFHAVRGEGMWLYDADGVAHLDCYNNVPHVGHGHPHVSNAVARQTAALNTNTRYLFDSVLEYADRLAERLPAGLDRVLFVNSGSEANDLAWRMARVWSGHSGALVTAGAYHGITEATAAFSPYDAAPGASPSHVAGLTPPRRDGGLPAPDGAATAGNDDPHGIEEAIERLGAAGHGVAATLIDSTLASDGILDAPLGWLDTLFTRVRAAGGLCIADEVQAGFGRLGTAWGFEALGATPDMVTLGKPAANGYPLGAVVTTTAVAEAFAECNEFFSTFGGNPVACTAGLAVLDVLDREGLQARAAEVGGYLHERLARLGTRHVAVGEVRGRGLFLGVELVSDGDRRAPAPEATARVALAMRRAGVLVGIEGPCANVLKIRPPLVCGRAHADRLVDALDRALGSG